MKTTAKVLKPKQVSIFKVFPFILVSLLRITLAGSNELNNCPRLATQLTFFSWCCFLFADVVALVASV